MDFKVSGYDENHHGIIQMGGIIDMDSTIVDTFSIQCKPCMMDRYSEKILARHNLTWDEWMDDPERLKPDEAMLKLLSYFEKHVNMRDSRDKFQFIGYHSEKHPMKFLRSFFGKNGNKHFDLYFWFPSIDLKYIAAFILEDERYRFPNLELETVAYYFGFDIDEKERFDAFYRVNLIRNLYYILERFKAQKIFFTKAKLN